jgi:hypothetical protein
VVSFIPQLLYPQRKSLWYLSDRSLDRPHNWSGSGDKEKKFHQKPSWELNPGHPACNIVPLLTELLQLLVSMLPVTICSYCENTFFFCSPVIKFLFIMQVERALPLFPPLFCHHAKSVPTCMSVCYSFPSVGVSLTLIARDHHINHRDDD